MKAVVFARDNKKFTNVFSSVNGYKLQISGRPLFYYYLAPIIPLKPESITVLINDKTRYIKNLFPEEKFGDIPVFFYCDDPALKDLFCTEDDYLVLQADNVFTADAFSRLSEIESISALCEFSEDYSDENFVNVDFDGSILKYKDFSVKKETFGNLFSGVLYFSKKTLGCFNNNFTVNSVYELFDYLLLQNVKVFSVNNDLYSIKVTDSNSLLRFSSDVLNNVFCQSEKNTDGVDFESNVKTGDYLVIPPVYIGKNVQIEKGSVIGPFVSVGNDCLISNGTKIKESILQNNVYVSSFCNIDKTVICDGVSVKRGATTQKRAVLGENSVIGEYAKICENVFIRENTEVGNNRIIAEFCDVFNSEKEITERVDFNEMLLPHKISKLGSAIGTVFKGSRVGIATDKEINSVALKYGLLSGLISTGVKTFDFGNAFHSQIFYFGKFCELDLLVYITGGFFGNSVNIYDGNGVELSITHKKVISEYVNNGCFEYVDNGRIKDVTVIKKLDSVYCNEVVRIFDGINTNMRVSGFSDNIKINACVKECFNRMGITGESDDLFFKINETGTRLSGAEKNRSYSHEVLCSIVSYDKFKLGEVNLDCESRSVVSSFENSVELEETLLNNVNELWQKDAVFLLFRVLYVMCVTKKSLYELKSELPEYYIVKKVIRLNGTDNNLTDNLLKKGFIKNKNGGMMLKEGAGRVNVSLGSDGKSLRFIAEAVSSEIAEEMYIKVENMIKSISIDNNSK